jgi:hypothetical protein
METVIAISSFDHDDQKVRRGQQLTVSPQTADDLVRNALVRRMRDPANPSKAAGTRSSASPAAPASPQTTAKQSAGGGRRRRAAASSSSTPRSA